MKIEIDTTAKQIKILEDTTFEKLERELSKMFPKDSWKDFTIVKEVQQIQLGYPFQYPTPYSPTVGDPNIITYAEKGTSWLDGFNAV